MERGNRSSWRRRRSACGHLWRLG